MIANSEVRCSPQPLPFWLHVWLVCTRCTRVSRRRRRRVCTCFSRVKKTKSSRARLRRGCSRYACILPRRNIDRVLFRPQRRHSTFPSSFVSLQPLAPPFLHLFPPCIPSSTVASLFCSSLFRLYPQISLFFFFFFFFIFLLPTLSFVSGSLTLPYPPGGGEPSLFATRTWFPHIKESYLLMRHNYPPFTMATRCPRGGESENRVRFGRVQSLTDRDTEGNDTQTIS